MKAMDNNQKDRIMNKFIYLLACTLFVSCQNNNKSSVTQMEVELDSMWCTRLMPGLGSGVTGGDGAISIDLKDGRNLFMWGDSFFGDVVDDKRSKDSKFVMGNTFTIINEKGELETLYSGDLKNPSAYILAEQDGDSPRWYWPGDGFVKDGILHLFMSKFRKVGEGSFGFEYMCCDYFRLDVKTMKIIDKMNIPAANQNGVHYGHAVMPYQNAIYIYGTKSDSTGAKAVVHVAKAELVDNKLANFVYWDGASWQADATKTAKLEGLQKNISEQFNVFSLNEKIVLVSQNRSGNAKEIYSYIADSPEGAFSHEKLLYTVDEPNFEKDSMMTYNTMVHPQYMKNDKILMCYNVNTYDLKKVFEKASLYQPRFFWVPVDHILKLLLGSVTAYCLQRFEFRFRRLVMGCFYLGMLVPTFVVEIARFKVIQSMGLYNTLGAPIIIYVASDLMQLYLYMQFVSKIPKALDESALIDGCGYFRIFYSIIFPLLAPATATVVILKIVNIVNDMYVPYLYMPKTKLKTLTTFLMNYAGAQQGSWPTLAAAIIVVLIPTVVLYLIFHKQITEGLSAGATKE